jgi:hypothetical protein
MMNNTNFVLIKLSTVLFGCYAVSVSVSAAPNPASKDYVNSTVIGQSVQGGVVFFTYLSGGGVHGLVAATADEPLSYTQGLAINQCASKVENGYSDWFLPNKAQITALFNNRFVIDPNDYNGGFYANPTGTANYWSSSFADDTNGWIEDFSGGTQTPKATTNPHKVRCVRFF